MKYPRWVRPIIGFCLIVLGIILLMIQNDFPKHSFGSAFFLGTGLAFSAIGMLLLLIVDEPRSS